MKRMLAPNSPNTFAGKLTVRSVFIIDPSKKLVRFSSFLQN